MRTVQHLAHIGSGGSGRVSPGQPAFPLRVRAGQRPVCTPKRTLRPHPAPDNERRPKAGGAVSGGDHKTVYARTALPARLYCQGRSRRPAWWLGICGRPQGARKQCCAGARCAGAGPLAHWNSRELVGRTAAALVRQPQASAPGSFGGRPWALRRQCGSRLQGVPGRVRRPSHGHRAAADHVPGPAGNRCHGSGFPLLRRREHHQVAAVLRRSVWRNYLSPD